MLSVTITCFNVTLHLSCVDTVSTLLMMFWVFLSFASLWPVSACIMGRLPVLVLPLRPQSLQSPPNPLPKSMMNFLTIYLLLCPLNSGNFECKLGHMCAACIYTTPLSFLNDKHCASRLHKRNNLYRPVLSYVHIPYDYTVIARLSEQLGAHLNVFGLWNMQITE